MIIIAQQTDGKAEITIDTKKCSYPFQFREAFELALRLEGFDQSTINEIFGITPDRCEAPNESAE